MGILDKVEEWVEGLEKVMGVKQKETVRDIEKGLREWAEKRSGEIYAKLAELGYPLPNDTRDWLILEVLSAMEQAAQRAVTKAMEFKQIATHAGL